MCSSSGIASNLTRRVSCHSRSLSLVCKIPISLLGLSETNTIGYKGGLSIQGLEDAARGFPTQERLSREPLRFFLSFLPAGFPPRQFLRSQSEDSKHQRCEWLPTVGDALAHCRRPAVLSLSTAMGRARLAVSRQGSARWYH
jgi:hypothetical protein